MSHILCFHGIRSRGTTSPLYHPSNQPAAPLMCHAQFLTNDGVHVVFSGDGEEETGLTPEVHRGRLLSDAYLPLQRQASKMAAATNKSDVVIVEDEEERLRITAQRVRDRRERMNNEIRRLKHFNSIIGREGDPQGMSLHNRCSQPSAQDHLGRSMCQPAPPIRVGVAHRSFSLPGDKTFGSSCPDSHSSDLDASGFGLQPLPEKDMPIMEEEGSGDLESLDLNSIPENEVNLSDDVHQ